MKIIEQNYSFINPPSYIKALNTVTDAASTCYMSHPKDKEKFVSKLVKAGHTSTIEHVSLTVKLVTDRAVTHELVRHRIASYSQESQRYVAYRENVTFVRPHWATLGHSLFYRWSEACAEAEANYKGLLSRGVKAEDARTVLPNSCATTIVFTMNFRSLLNFFHLRASKRAHPDIRRFALELREYCINTYPAFFEHLVE